MRSVILSKGFVAGCSLALALSATACADNDRTTMDEGGGTALDPAREAQTGTAGHEGAPITLTGCLQKGDRSNFVITQVNEPSSAARNNGAGAQAEQMRAARHSYELDSDDDDQFESLVGKQVKVTGTIAENSDLSRPNADQQVGTSGDRTRTDSDNRADIDVNDLAKVDVQSVVQVADTCGDAAAK